MDDPNRTFHKTIGQIGLFLIALGNGGIKPCVVAFGADQFKQEQTEAKEQYFKLFYATINAGAVIAAYLTPELRKFDCYPGLSKDQFVDVYNSSEMASVFDQCHRNSFMLTSISMGMGLVLFMVPVFYTWIVNQNCLRKSSLCYKIEDKKEGSVIFEFFGAMADAFRGFISRVTPGNRDQGFFKYARNFTNAQRYSFNIVIQIFVLFLPLLFFHASLEAIGTLWTYQAKELNGFMPWAKRSCRPKPIVDYILADQMEVFNNLFVLLFTPVITLAILPCFNNTQFVKCSLKKKKPLFLMALGLFLVGSSQVVAGFLQKAIDAKATFNSVHENEFQTPVKHVFHPDFENQHKIFVNGEIYNGQVVEYESLIKIDDMDEFQLTKIEIPPPKSFIFWSEINGTINHNTIKAYQTEFTESELRTDLVYNSDTSAFTKLNEDFCGDSSINMIFPSNLSKSTFEISAGRNLSILLQLPQYAILTIGEVILATTALEFAYSQSGLATKSLCTALYYATSSLGNIGVILLKSVGAARANQLFITALATYVAVVFLLILSRGFKVRDEKEIAELTTEGKCDYSSGVSKEPLMGSSIVVSSDKISI